MTSFSSLSQLSHTLAVNYCLIYQCYGWLYRRGELVSKMCIGSMEDKFNKRLLVLRTKINATSTRTKTAKTTDANTLPHKCEEHTFLHNFLCTGLHHVGIFCQKCPKIQN